MFHIFSVCPSSLVSGKIHSYFSSTKGNFVAQNVPNNFNSPFTWNNTELSDDERLKLKSYKEYLIKKNAMFNISGIKNVDQLLNYLNSPNCKIENAITEEIINSSCLKLVNCEEFLFNNIDNLSKSCDIPKTAENLLDLIKPYCLTSFNFKLIDPYFYKGWLSGSQNLTVKKLEFLAKLCNHLSKNHREVNSVTIEVYGQGFDNDKSSRGNFFANFLKNQLSNLIEFENLYHQGLLEINFYGLEPQNEKKIHDRLFLCEQFSLNLNDGFYSEPNINNEITLIRDTKRVEKFEDMYHKDTKDFYVNFNFSLEDIFDNN